MVQVLKNRDRSFADAILGGVAESAYESGQMIPKYQEYQKKANENKEVDKYLEGIGYKNTKNLPTDFKKQIFSEHIKSQYRPKKEPKAKEPIGFSDTANFLKNTGYDQQFIQQLGAGKMNEITKLAQHYSLEMPHEDALYRASQEVITGKPGGSFTDQVTGKQQQQPSEQQMAEKFAQSSPEEQEGIMAAAQKGIQDSVFGRVTAITDGIPYSQYQKQNELKNDSFINRQAKSFARMLIGNLPLFLSGGFLGAKGGAAAGSVAGPFGAAVGGLLGGGAGAVALPEMLDTALEEYHKYLESGGDKPFDAFVEGALKTVKKGTEAGIEGATFGILGQMMPMLKQIPQLATLFEKPIIGKVAEQATKGAVEAGGILAQKTAAKGELPSKEEIADTFTQVIGFNVFGGLTENAKETITKLVHKSGKSADFVASELADRIAKGEVKNQKDVIKTVKDITSERFQPETEIEQPKERGFNLKTEATPEREAARGVFEALSNIQTPEPAKTAAKLAERPVGEALSYEKRLEEKKNKPLTEKEQAKRSAAQEKVDKIDNQIAKVKDDIEFLEEKTKSGTAENKSLSKAGLKGKQNELESLEKERKKFESIAKKGIEPFSKESLSEPIQKHMNELEQAAKEPEGVTAQEWKQMFARDQKYVNEFAKILEKGELPDPEYKDRFIKTLEVYQEAYKNHIERAKERLKAIEKQYEGMNKRTKEAKALRNERDHLRRKEKLLEENFDINKSKIGLQKEKLASLFELRKPPAALTKQILKNMRKDLVDLQHDFIKQKNELDALEKKTESKAKEAIREGNRLLKEYMEKPTRENLDKYAESQNIPKEVINSALEQAKGKAKEVAETLINSIEKPSTSKKLRPIGETKADRKAKEELAAKAALREAENLAKDYLTEFLKDIDKKVKDKLKKLPMIMFWSEVQDAIEQMTGYRIPFNVLSVIGGKSIPEMAARSTIATIYKNIRKHFAKKMDKSIYDRLRTPQEKFEYRKRLEDKYSSKDVKEIIS